MEKLLRVASGRVRKDTRRRSRGIQNFGKQWWKKLTLPRRGEKESLLQPTDQLDPKHQEEIIKRRETLRRAVSVPRSTRTRQIITADWSEEKRLAVVIKQRGSIISSMGVYDDGKQYLWPEEVLFLLDKGTMDLRVDGVPCSFQKAWTLCYEKEDGRFLEKHIAYCHLKRAGYVVRRVQYRRNEGLDSEANDVEKELTADFVVWRVGAFRRRIETKPLFCVKAFSYEDKLPSHAATAALCEKMDRTKVRAALVNRGVVMLVDLACNATPLSDRYTSRFAAARIASGEEKMAGELRDSIGASPAPAELDQDLDSKRIKSKSACENEASAGQDNA
eukprot:Plantae.Rhodophyta-Hildenbrandia_rubra.ctg7799.p1 GENE.Plantae.Rhodophyta-Hildenbrandia_rubra.ctg7799~~Plantae.Rhodophyta-Hildenbrandia_rubra.ctg7799.p1  ORF type:complete len:333 (-),score=57.80 Plantae.Rhodophyta-Hildenbrandia_rubra.ctg7799:234-1232(-)